MRPSPDFDISWQQATREINGGMSRRIVMAVGLVAIAACAAASRPAPTLTPVFTTGVWRIRIDVDSAPTRFQPTKPVFGTVDFASGHFAIDFRQAIARTLPNAAHVVQVTPEATGQPPQYKITLGDSTSFDDKIILLGRPVTADSIVGMWSETILCCSAVGRFVLWRVSPLNKERR
jgi:hypothetical protein